MIIPHCNYTLDNQEVTVYDFSKLPLDYFSFQQPETILTIPTGNKINGAPSFYAIINKENKMNIVDLRSPCEQLMLIFSKRGWLRTKEVEDIPAFDINSLEEHYDAITNLNTPENRTIDILLKKSLYTLII